MLATTMNDQSGVVSERFPTKLTFVRLVAGMRPSVGVQRGLMLEALVAKAAWEHFLLRMYSFVYLQHTLAFKFGVANVAMERSLARVCSYMSDQGASLRISLVAISTLEGLLLHVNRHMAIQVSFFCSHMRPMMLQLFSLTGKRELTKIALVW